jgi:hypothetical protein
MEDARKVVAKIESMISETLNEKTKTDLRILHKLFVDIKAPSVKWITK